MGSITFSQSGSNKYGSYTAQVEVNYSESYSPSTNKTTVTLTSVEFYVSNYFGSSPCYGTISFAGQTVKTFSGGYTNTASGGSWNTVTNSSGGSVVVSHNSSGAASMGISVSGFYVSFNGADFYANGSGTATLTPHTSTLTVNPNGGTWNGSTSSQSFAQAPTSTKTIANPTRTGYTFGGWTLSGGGSISNGTYTYGASSGTLTANWTINTWTVSYNANGGAGAPDSQTKTYGQTLTLSSTVPTRTGYSFLGWSTSSTATTATYQPGGSYTANADAVLYAVWRVISYTLSATVSDRGLTANILRTASPIGGGASSLLADGDTVYYNDVIKVSWAIGGGYQAETFQINGEDVSLLAEKTITVTEQPIVILVVELGAMVYIGNDMYQAFINDGTGWSQYQAYIGNGSSWEAY